MYGLNLKEERNCKMKYTTLAKIGVALVALTPTGAWKLKKATTMIAAANEAIKEMTKAEEE